MTLPLLCPPPPGDLPPLRIKAHPEDFIVEELPLYEPCGSGTHTYIWIEKRNLNTLDAVRRIAGILRQKPPDAGIAGLKDARAVCRQWISFEHVKTGVDELLNLNDERLKIIKISAHGNKLKRGHLRGNRFRIRLRLAESVSGEMLEKWLARAQAILAALSLSGFPNYFGPQRFGRGGENAGLGRLLVNGKRAEFDQAFASAQGHGRRAERGMRNLLVNAFQSELFNRVLTARMPHIGRLEAGDLAWLHRNGAVFAVAGPEDAAREQLRADHYEISPSGPVFGAKSLLASGGPGEIEEAVLRAEGLRLEDFGRPEAERQPGARRSLRALFLEPPECALEPDGLLVCFALPPGSYATVVLREIIGDASARDLGDVPH